MFLSNGRMKIVPSNRSRGGRVFEERTDYSKDAVFAMDQKNDFE